MNLDTPANKTKIVCTIGPASDSAQMLQRMLEAGMNVARLNFSHGDYDYHRAVISRIREATAETGCRVAIMGDLPGPKMRIGQLEREPIELSPGEFITLTTDRITGDRERVSVSFAGLPAAVNPGDTLFLNDGYIQLEVLGIRGNDVECEVIVGGELRSRKGLNLPGIDLGISAFTEDDRRWLKFAAKNAVDAVSQSFVAGAEDIQEVRRAAEALDYKPFIIAKIERAGALERLDGILEAADGMMVARGDLGVEIPIERIAVEQKNIMRLANRAGKPVITATQMLESMVEYSRPTRAEATDVANAILDGADCVMLSGESAMGRYPVESVRMLAAIASVTEPKRPKTRLSDILLAKRRATDEKFNVVDLIALSVHHTSERVRPLAVFVPSSSGSTARNVTRFRLPVWIIAFTPNASTCQALQFSWGIHPIKVENDLPDWNAFIRRWLAGKGEASGLALLTQGPTEQHPCANQRLEILDLDAETGTVCVESGVTD